MDVVIAPARDAELPVLCKLFNRARVVQDCFPEKEYTVSEFQEAIAGEQILTARVGDEIAGFASVWVPEIFLHHFYVSPHYQRQGVGAFLLKQCVRHFGTPMSLKCLESNVPARHFYEKQGWLALEVADGPEGCYLWYVRN